MGTVTSPLRPPPAPAWLLDMIRPKPYTPPSSNAAVEPNGGGGGVGGSSNGRGVRYAEAGLQARCAELAGAPEGTRNATAFLVACRLHELANAPWSGLGEQVALGAYLRAAQAAHETGGSGFPESEALAVWGKAQRHVGGRAATLPEPTVYGSLLPVPPPFAEPAPAASGGATPGVRHALDVSNQSIAADWLRDNLGRGRLAGVFRRGRANRLVYTPAIGEDGYRAPAPGDDDGPAQVQPMTARELAARVQWAWAPYRTRKAREDDENAVALPSGETVVRVPTLFPLEAVSYVVAAPDACTHTRRLNGVVHTPVVRADGSILDAPGYDAATKLLHLPEPGMHVPPVAASPTPEQVVAARELLLFMVKDFPFVTDHDRAAWLGGLFTPLLRDLAPPPYKLLAVNAHQAGSGKTLLATVIRTVHGGVFRAEMPEDDAELRKQVTTVLDTTTGPVVHVDNVSGLLRSSVLAGLLTSAAWDDRRLGANDLARCVNDRLWVITGNNVALGGDLIRRTVWVSIDPGRPDPQLRQGFAIDDLEGWAREHRGAILHALLTLVRAWVAAGRPGTATSSDGYARWVRTVNGILSVAGVSGTFDAPEARQQVEGAEDQDWAAFLGAVEASFGSGGWTTKDLLARVEVGYAVHVEGQVGIPMDALPAELVDKMSRAGVPALGRSLGRWLTNRQGRWAGGLTVRSVGEEKRATRWKVVRYSPSA